MTNSPALVVFGPQGSGKSTQVERLASNFNLRVIETGEILRQRARTDEALHQLIKSGALVPDNLVLEIIEAELKVADSSQGLVFDGYPRTMEEFGGFSSLAQRYDWKVAGIFIDLSDESAKKRLSTRFELVDGQKVVREDDQPAIVQKRLDTFKHETLPLKDEFADQFQLIEIDGEPSVDDVTSQITAEVTQFIADES